MGTEAALRAAVEEWLPAQVRMHQPAWRVLVLPNTPSAPIVSISRDPRSGARATPVFFVGPGDQRRLLVVGQGMFEETRVARLFHTGGASPDSAFLVIPALYHLDPVEEFSDAVERYLASLGLDFLAWRREHCEVRIWHLGQTYQARRDQDGSFVVVAAAET